MDMPLHAYAYVSTARAGLDVPELDALLADATAFNRMAGVTGVLMFDGSRFLQYIEGPRDGLASVQARISNARRHGSVTQLAAGPIPARWFPRWTMANRHVDAATLASIVAAPWHGFSLEQNHLDHGFCLLLRAWTGGHGELEPAAVSLGS
ncbi:BLUF domain-containing protein [Stenotrophomonas sp. NA06056]|uniref:BLUF domain-containing protein n=1 Tax=Stenotrophomonas sp. NA06056 TaxID=2742129 RepID=UPI0020CB2676|nr:BLUF domain-containing protein [Stenotrophomonas sp. NA06056]